MTAKKVTVSFQPATHALAEQAARRAGLSLSAWLDRVARREAVRTGVGPVADNLDDALADEVELAAAEEDLRAAG